MHLRLSLPLRIAPVVGGLRDAVGRLILFAPARALPRRLAGGQGLLPGGAIHADHRHVPRDSAPRRPRSRSRALSCGAPVREAEMVLSEERCGCGGGFTPSTWQAATANNLPPRSRAAWKEGIRSGKSSSRRLNCPRLFSHRPPARHLQLFPADRLVWLLVCRLWQEAPERF